MIAHRSSQIHEAVESMMSPSHTEPLVLDGKGVRPSDRDMAREQMRFLFPHLDMN